MAQSDARHDPPPPDPAPVHPERSETPDEVIKPDEVDGVPITPDETDFNPVVQEPQFIERAEGQTYTWEQLSALSTQLAKSRLLPEVYRGHPENVMVMSIMAQELGWGVATAMRFIHIIEGKPTISPEGMLALVRRAGHSVSGEADDKVCQLRGRRADNGDELWVRFSMADAVVAGLAGKDNWKKYPEAMLWARALGMLCRRLFSDVLLGAGYTPDEMGAVTDEQGNPIYVEPEPRNGKQRSDGVNWAQLGWRDESDFNNHRTETKVLLDALPREARDEIRRTLGTAPDVVDYNIGIWSNRHGAVVDACRKLGLLGDDDKLIAHIGVDETDSTPDQDEVAADRSIDKQTGEIDAAQRAAADEADRQWVAEALGDTENEPPELPEAGAFDLGGYG